MQTKKEGEKRRQRNAILLLAALLLHALLINAPPSPHNIQGKVFNIDGTTGVPNGVLILLNNTNSTNTLVLTQTSAPPPPQFRGSYSASINGSDNDTIVATSWNATYYGTNTTNLSTATTSLNIVLSTIRPSETNVSISIPQNNSRINITRTINVTARVAIIGGQDGINCNATIVLSNPASFNITQDQNLTNQLGDIPRGSFRMTKWNSSANLDGVSNITVLAQCQSDGLNFDHLNSYTASNFTVQDIEMPIVSLISPLNNSYLNADASNHTIAVFTYNVTDGSPIKNCTLILNNRINMSNTSVVKFLPQLFHVRLYAKEYNWSVNCTDNSTLSNANSSVFYNFTVIPNFPPQVNAVAIQTPIDLLPGSAQFVTCNATVLDLNNRSDIAVVNATLYQSPKSHFSADDFNDHYANASCHATGNSTYESNHSCGFSLEYFANNGTWTCNITSTDSLNTTGYSSASFVVNELLAIEITPSSIDYGALQATNISELVNMSVTNRGNIPFNVTVEGYGVTPADGLAMDCTTGTIPVSNQRYHVNNSLSFLNMTALSIAAVEIGNLTLFQRTDELLLGNSSNITHWRLAMPTLVQGSCNGTVVFRTRIG